MRFGFRSVVSRLGYFRVYWFFWRSAFVVRRRGVRRFRFFGSVGLLVLGRRVWRLVEFVAFFIFFFR